MRRAFLVIVLVWCVVAAPASAQSQVPVTIVADLDPNSAAGIRTEGLVADGQGRLYTIDLESRRLFRITAATGAVEVLGTLPRPASGMAFDRAGNLYMASGELILRVAAGPLNAVPLDPASVQTFATGTAGANGLAFDGRGNLYVSGGATGNIYRVAPDGSVATPISGLRSDREEQPISTNGIQFGTDGRLYSANTGSGAIDRIAINADGSAGPVERIAQDQRLRGADGIVFAANGDLYVAVNERNAIVRIATSGEVTDITSNSNAGPLEFPASAAFVGNDLYVVNFDVARGANAPADPGIGASVARIAVGVGGAPLPVGATPAPPTVPTPDPGPPAPVLTTTASPTGTAGLAPTAIVGTTTTPFITGTTTALTPTATFTLPGGLTGTPTPSPTVVIPAQLPDTAARAPSQVVPVILVGITAVVVGLYLRRTRQSR
jgi:sugar lactone lactonase YvrE